MLHCILSIDVWRVNKAPLCGGCWGRGESPYSPPGRGLCSPARQLSRSSLQLGNLGHGGAELYPSELCDKCHFYSCWRTSLVTLHYLLTFQEACGPTPLPVCSASAAPSLPWLGTGCLRARLPPNLLFTCCQLTLVISGASKSLAKQKRGQQYCLSGLASVYPNWLFLAVAALDMELQEHEQVFPVSQPPFLPKDGRMSCLHGKCQCLGCPAPAQSHHIPPSWHLRGPHCCSC